VVAGWLDPTGDAGGAEAVGQTRIRSEVRDDQRE
jgi:hypothetical protein